VTRRRPWAVLLLLLVTAVVTWQVVAGGPLTHADLPLSHWSQRHGQFRGNLLVVAVGDCGNWWIAGPVALVVAAIRSQRSRPVRPLVPTALTLTAVTLIFIVFKHLVDRGAPVAGADGGVYPSGHTATAVVAFGLLRGGWRGLLAGALAGPAVGAAVVALDYHWLTDVLGAWPPAMALLIGGAGRRGGLPEPGQSDRAGDGDEEPGHGDRHEAGTRMVSEDRQAHDGGGEGLADDQRRGGGGDRAAL